MEANTPYALYDNDGTRPMQWAAHIRLTPELLLKLQQAPEQVLLTLNASSADARKNTKKTSLLSVDMGASAAAADGENGLERYELHSFQEDPRVNYLCTFRQDGAHRKPAVAAKADSDTSSQVADRAKDASGGGFSVYTTGKIYQKLIVQRMLDSTEKDRMKDRHAQSVIESRSRASKLLEDEPLATGKRKRVSLFSTQFSKTPDAKAVDAPLRKIVLPSALSAKDAQTTRERIEKGFKKMTSPPAPVSDTILNKQQAAKTSKTAAAKMKGKKAGQASLFSSDSDGTGEEEEKEKVSVPVKVKPAPTKPTELEATKSPSQKKASDTTKKIRQTPDALALETDTSAASAAAATTTPAQAFASQAAAVAVAPQQQQPKPRRPPVASDTKRPLPRASRIPDLSFFPLDVTLICKRISAHTTRSVVLDEEDYDTFVQQHEGFRADWETLDKAYSIEMINIEGLHVRMQFAADDRERAELEREHQENAKKKEALLFVREAMASIQKILAGIQVSIARYDRKQL